MGDEVMMRKKMRMRMRKSPCTEKTVGPRGHTAVDSGMKGSLLNTGIKHKYVGRRSMRSRKKP